MVRIEFIPQSETDLVVFKPCWRADNGYETAVFATEVEAREFAKKRWGNGSAAPPVGEP